MLCYAKHVVGTVHRLHLSTTKCTCWYYKRTTSKTEYYVMNVSAYTYNEKKQPVSLICLSDVLPAFLPFSFYADQSVLLSLLIYFIRIGVYVVQFHILIQSLPISSYPFFNTCCYLTSRK